MTKSLEHIFDPAYKYPSRYSLELVEDSRRPLTFTFTFSTFKPDKKIDYYYHLKDKIEICRLIIYGDRIGIEIKNKKTLPEKACHTIRNDYIPRQILTHADVIIFEAMPQWIAKAADAVSSGMIDYTWLITVNLLNESKFKADRWWDFNKESRSFSTFSKEDYSKAVILSQKQVPKNISLQKAITDIPKAYEKLQDFRFGENDVIIPIEPYVEPSFEECVMDERKAEGRDLGGGAK